MGEVEKRIKTPRVSTRSDVVQYLRAFVPFFWKNFIHDRIFLGAGSLAFQTLLSIVPVLAVILSILSVFSIFAPFKRSIEDFLVQNFMPGAGAVLNHYLSDFIGKTASVPLLGGVFLFIIALFLISTVDHTLNEIWEVYSPRKTLQGFTLYWTVLTLGPVLIGSSLAASSYVWYTVFTEGPLLELKTRLLSYLPFINSVFAFFLLYMLVPNCRVRFLHAMSGAFLSAVLLEMSKIWFVFYVTHLSTFEHIYGGLSVIPMLFFWIYLGWVVVLTGAEFVFCLGALKPMAGIAESFNPLRGVPVILTVISSIWNGQKHGRSMNMKKILKTVHSVHPSGLRKIVDILIQNDLIHVTANGDLAVSQDLYDFTLFDLYAIIPPGFASDENVLLISDGNSVHLKTISRGVSECLKNRMGMPIVTLLEDINQEQL
ncbi:MAG: YihY family inner membrane protein [Chlorobiales bacterium]|nr:YihY family inner membrane protein [Chlorobiales bacterium]